VIPRELIEREIANLPESPQRKVYDFAVGLKTRVSETPFDGAARDWNLLERGLRVGKPVAGEGVVIPFPQTDLAVGKGRPPLVLVDLPGDDLILCQITTRHRSDDFSVSLVRAERRTTGKPPASHSNCLKQGLTPIPARAKTKR
jgi:hypothetical protein